MNGFIGKTATNKIAAVTAAFLLSTVAAKAQEKKSPPIPGLHAYTKGHAQNESAPELLGGALTVNVEQTGGITYFVLPGPRWMDPSVFGTPDKPAGFEPAPFPLMGVPLDMRNSRDGEYTFVAHATPFSDWAESGKGSLSMTLVDRTAIDAAQTQDEIDFEATFSDPDGNAYRVTCNKPLPHGKAHPFFGGVVTNHLLHGHSGVGTPMMPTEFTHAAFWGVGDVYKNDEKIAEGQLVHVMVTEFVRGAGYKLLFDGEVGNPPEGKTIHLMVPPYKPTPEGIKPAPLKTGFMPFPYVQKHLKSDMQRARDTPEDERTMRTDPELLGQVKAMMEKTKKHVMEETEAGNMNGQPFFHVMFNDFTLRASR